MQPEFFFTGDNVASTPKHTRSVHCPGPKPDPAWRFNIIRIMRSGVTLGIKRLCEQTRRTGRKEPSPYACPIPASARVSHWRAAEIFSLFRGTYVCEFSGDASTAFDFEQAVGVGWDVFGDAVA